MPHHPTLLQSKVTPCRKRNSRLSSCHIVVHSQRYQHTKCILQQARLRATSLSRLQPRLFLIVIMSSLPQVIQSLLDPGRVHNGADTAYTPTRLSDTTDTARIGGALPRWASTFVDAQ
jgi:hypothetical protein